MEEDNEWGFLGLAGRASSCASAVTAMEDKGSDNADPSLFPAMGSLETLRAFETAGSVVLQVGTRGALVNEIDDEALGVSRPVIMVAALLGGGSGARLGPAPSRGYSNGNICSPQIDRRSGGGGTLRARVFARRTGVCRSGFTGAEAGLVVLEQACLNMLEI